MTQEEMDKLIADAVADSKKKSKWHRPNKKGLLQPETVTQMRTILNFLFMAGFAVALVIYFVFPEHKTLFFCVGFGSVILKIIEFILRFMF